MARVAMITEYKRIDYFMSDLLKIMVYEEYSRIKSHCRLVVDWITVKQPSEEKFPIILICSIVFYYKDKKRNSFEKVRVSLKNIKKGTGSLSQWKKPEHSNERQRVFSILTKTRLNRLVTQLCHVSDKVKRQSICIALIRNSVGKGYQN